MAIAGQQKKLAVDYSKLPVKPAPAQAASVPQLGPPLPGDWGAASAMTPLPNGGAGAGPGPSAEAVDRQRQAEEIAVRRCPSAPATTSASAMSFPLPRNP